MQQHKRLRPASDVARIRVERPMEPELASEDAGSWAVSYSDLLMVLMSFFVIFFSFDKDTKHMAQKLALTVDRIPSEEATQSPAVSNTGASAHVAVSSDRPVVPATGANADPVAKGTQPRFESTLADALSTAGFAPHASPDSDEISIDLEDNLYRPREFSVNEQAKKDIRKVLALVQSHSSTVTITFIGHADSAPVTKRDNVLTDNDVLSALRATSALQVAAGLGFPASKLFAQAGAERSRNTRSLSIVIHAGQAPAAH